MLLLSVLCFFALSVPAGAVTLVNPDGSVAQPFQTWANRASIPKFDATIQIDYDTTRCQNDIALGCATPGRVSINGGPHCSLPQKVRSSCRYIFLHELGHAFNFAVVNTDQESAFKSLALWPSDWRLVG